MSNHPFIRIFLNPSRVLGCCVCLLLAALVGSAFAATSSTVNDGTKAKTNSHLEEALSPPFNLDDPARIAAGKELFSSSCSAYCHGDPPPLFVGRTNLTPAFVYTVIRTGGIGKNKPMPAWGTILTKEQIWELVAYLKSLGNWPPLP